MKKICMNFATAGNLQEKKEKLHCREMCKWAVFFYYKREQNTMTFIKTSREEGFSEGKKILSFLENINMAFVWSRFFIKSCIAVE